jgi:hypothetical protein
MTEADADEFAILERVASRASVNLEDLQVHFRHYQAVEKPFSVPEHARLHQIADGIGAVRSDYSRQVPHGQMN